VRFELNWKLLSAKDGDLIPADMYSDPANLPGMVVTFRIQRVYKGNMGSEVQFHTGIGGGDCAAIYSPGLNYLVFAYGSSRNQLGVSMCSPGGWIGNEKVETELRYLRNEHPTPKDLEQTGWWWTKPNATQIQERWKRAAEDGRKRYDAATGRICGLVTRPHSEDELRGAIAFLSTQGSYPSGQSESSINADGSFCSSDLGPGKYYLYFVRGSEHGLAAALYYPGVADVARATAIEVAAGQMISNVAFKTEAQSSYSVRGVVAFSDKPDFGSDGVTILLIRTDGDRRVWYSGKAKSILSKLAYFEFDDVLPGNYAACAVVPASGWMTKKADLSVTDHLKFLSLDLVRKK